MFINIFIYAGALRCFAVLCGAVRFIYLLLIDNLASLA